MFPVAPLLATLFLVISIAVSPVDARSTVTLPFAKRISTSGGNSNLVQQDQARAAALKHNLAVHPKRQTISSANAISNQAVSYIASVGVGKPPTTYNLIVDTGTSNTWLGAGKPYIPTNTSHKTGDDVSVSYGLSSFSGELWYDTVTLSDAIVSELVSIGVANRTTGFDSGVDGVLGLGPIDLTIGTMTNKPYATIPTIADTIYDTAVGGPFVIVGVLFAPSMGANDRNGALTFGGPDPSHYTGKILYTPITSTQPASNFWGIDQSISYGEETILTRTAGIVDTGTALILIASDAYAAYKSVTGGTEDEATGLLQLTASQYDNLQDLTFDIGTGMYKLTPNGQIWPRALNSYISGSNNAIYSIVNSIGTPSGQGFDFVNGQAFVERFYSVFDTLNWQVGFATTNYTNATSN